MTFALASSISHNLPWDNNSDLNVKAIVGALNQEKALVGAFSVIVKTDGSFAALILTLIKAVLYDVTSKLCVDTARMHVSGMSNGGMFIWTRVMEKMAATFASAGTGQLWFWCRAANDPSVFTITEKAPTRAFPG